MQVLEATGCSESRSGKMDIDDFLKWLPSMAQLTVSDCWLPSTRRVSTSHNHKTKNNASLDVQETAIDKKFYYLDIKLLFITWVDACHYYILFFYYYV